MIARTYLLTLQESSLGSQTCSESHQEIYQRWNSILLAHIIQEPTDPEVVLGDFLNPDPLVDFDLTDVAFTYGSTWKQLYFTRIGSDFFVLPAQYLTLGIVPAIPLSRRYHGL